MPSLPRWNLWIAAACAASVLACAQEQTEWSEAEIVERFLALSPQARELRGRVALAEAEARRRTVYSNPAVSYSREGAGYNTFVEASQTLPLSRRVRYLRDAGTAAVSVADAGREAAVWFLRSDLRFSFYQMIAAQERARLLSAGVSEVEQLAVILRQREREGEGSRYDRLRAEREMTELHIDGITANVLIAAARGRLGGYLPEHTRVQTVHGSLTADGMLPDLEALQTRAMDARADYRAEQKAVTRFAIEEQAARRLRIPEPLVSGGVKRADVASGFVPGASGFSSATRTGLVFGISVPLPVFNDGRYEVARYQVEQEQAKARAAVLARQIQSEVEGAYGVLATRRQALTAYRGLLAGKGAELTRITRVAYDEGEVGILELLDSLRVTRLASLRLLDLQAGVREAWIELERVLGFELTGGEVRP